MSLIISTALLDAMRRHAVDAGAQECCGLLLGDPLRGHVGNILPAANVAAEPQHRFEIDPVVLLAAHRAARAGGPGLIGHYHSHPAGAATPSATDAAMAERRGEIWLIMGSDGQASAWRAGASGRLHDCFEPVELTAPPHPDLAPAGPWGHESGH